MDGLLSLSGKLFQRGRDGWWNAYAGLDGVSVMVKSQY